jgi:hypothetical protein
MNGFQILATNFYENTHDTVISHTIGIGMVNAEVRSLQGAVKKLTDKVMEHDGKIEQLHLESQSFTQHAQHLFGTCLVMHGRISDVEHGQARAAAAAALRFPGVGRPLSGQKAGRR